MSPIPRLKPSSEQNGERKIRIRLDTLIALMVLQIILSIGIWLDRSGEKPQEQMDIIESKGESAAQSSVTITEPTEAIIEESFEEAVQEPDSFFVDWSMIKIDVLNGCGVQGLASRMADWLSRNGFRVRLTENADRHDYPKSFVQDRSGNITAARELAQALNIDQNQILVFDGTTSSEVDLTLVIGKDYKRLPIVR